MSEPNSTRPAAWSTPGAAAVKARLARLAVSVPRKLDQLSADPPSSSGPGESGWRRYLRAARQHLFGTLNIYRLHRQTQRSLASTSAIATRAALEISSASRQSEFNAKLIRELAGRLAELERKTANELPRDRFEHDIRRELELQRAALAGMAQSLASLPGASGGEATERPGQPDHDEVLNQFLNLFYARFEDRFRGSPEEISARLETYLPDIRLLLSARGHLKALDLGCGRGEWLALMKREGIDALGVDSNSGQIEGAAERGIKIVQADVFAFLAEQEASSYDLVSAFHLIEHLSLSDMVQLLQQAMRVLTPGGMLIIETPNPESVLVGAWKFRLDPTHQNPLPPDLLAAMAEALGFAEISVRRMSEDPRLAQFDNKDPELREVAHNLYGPRDYGLIARKHGP